MTQATEIIFVISILFNECIGVTDGPAAVEEIINYASAIINTSDLLYYYDPNFPWPHIPEIEAIGRHTVDSSSPCGAHIIPSVRVERAANPNFEPFDHDFMHSLLNQTFMLEERKTVRQMCDQKKEIQNALKIALISEQIALEQRERNHSDYT